MISLIIPVFNNIKSIYLVFQSIVENLTSDDQLIIIDDFSTDGTREFLNSLKDESIKVVLQNRNQGKGAAISKGINFASGDISIIQDADLEYDPNEYQKLINPILANKADVVYGSRFKGAEPHRVVYFWHRVGNGFLTLLSNIMTDINLSDMETCYKAFRTEVLKEINIREKRFGFEPEITAKVARKRCRIYEVGISYFGRTYEEGKKIGWKDGVRAIWCILKYNLFTKN
jgi:glycosyltransferase involved in cell wall biosynthesis